MVGRHVVRGLALLVSAQLLAGCGTRQNPSPPSGSSPIPQTSPQAAPQGFVRQAKRVRVYVSDSAFRALAGVRVEVLDGPQTGMSATTNESGWVWVDATSDQTTRFRASKEGYTSTESLVIQPGVPEGYLVMIMGVPMPPLDLAGDYTLTFVADDACVGIPEELRTRSYAATIAPSYGGRNPDGTFFWATISGVSFLADQRRIPIGVAGDFVSFWLGEDGYGAALVEQVAPDSYLEFDGGVGVSVGASAVSTISTTFDGSADYCVQHSEMGKYYDCDSRRAVTNVHCFSHNHRLILTRR